MFSRSGSGSSIALLPFCLCDMERFFAIVNPAAGGGRSAKLAGPALAQLREKGLHIDVIASTGPGHAVLLAREAYEQGYRRFLAVGGDGTAHEIINGIFAGRAEVKRIALGFLPLGTGNSFLRDFSKDGAAASLQAILEGRSKPVDLLRLTHASGTIYSFNLLSVGFTADVAALTNRYFKPFGALGYLLGVLVRVIQLRRRAFALRCDEEKDWDERRSPIPRTAGSNLCAGGRSAASAFCACCQSSMTARTSNTRWHRAKPSATWSSTCASRWT